jgi:hypothetical protein
MNVKGKLTLLPYSGENKVIRLKRRGVYISTKVVN